MSSTRDHVQVWSTTHKELKYLSEFYRVPIGDLLVDIMETYRQTDEYRYAQEWDGPPMDHKKLAPIRYKASQRHYWNEMGGREKNHAAKKERAKRRRRETLVERLLHGDGEGSGSAV